MKNNFKNRLVALASAALVAAGLAVLPAQAQDHKEKRFLVRFDHGTANLAPWAGLALYVGPERVRVLAKDQTIHEIPVARITSVTHELRAPFDPAKTTERVFNDTVGACSNIVDCAVLGSAGAVGAAGVGVATLFTPKETVITINWLEEGQPNNLAMKIAWYQKDFILSALRKVTGRAPTERTTAARLQPPQQQPQQRPAPAAGQVVSAAAQTVPAVAQAATAPAAPPVAARPMAPQAHRELVYRFDLILDRQAKVGGNMLEPGFYLVMMQERPGAKANVVLLDDSVRGTQNSKIVARAMVDVANAENITDFQPIVQDDPGGARLAEIRMPGKILKFN